MFQTQYIGKYLFFKKYVIIHPRINFNDDLAKIGHDYLITPHRKS